MSTTAQKSATTPIPVQLSEPEFTAFLLPHLSMPKRGPQCKLGYYRVFNLILWVLYTGMQWKCLPIPQDTNGKPAIHYTTVYKVDESANSPTSPSGALAWDVPSSGGKATQRTGPARAAGGGYLGLVGTEGGEGSFLG